MKKNILYFIAGVIITIIVGLIIINNGKEGKNINKQVSFEDKEKCMKYYDSYKNILEDRRNSDENSREEFGYSSHLSSYEMFYSPILDSCVSAYNILGFIYDRDDNMQPYPNDTFMIVDYLNGEKEIYSCSYNAYMIYLNGGDYSDTSCTTSNREKEKDIYKK